MRAMAGRWGRVVVMRGGNVDLCDEGVAFDGGHHDEGVGHVSIEFE